MCGILTGILFLHYASPTQALEAIQSIMKIVRERNGEIPQGVRKQDLDQVYKRVKDSLSKPVRSLNGLSSRLVMPSLECGTCTSTNNCATRLTAPGVARPADAHGLPGVGPGCPFGHNSQGFAGGRLSLTAKHWRAGDRNRDSSRAGL
jgi:hypothetical protein